MPDPTVPAHAAASCRIGVAETFGAIAKDLDPIRPVVRGEPRLVLEVPQKLRRIRQALPDRGQKGSPMRAVLQDQAVLAGVDLADQVGLVAELQRLGGGQDRQVDLDLGPFLRGQGREPRIAKGRGKRVLGHVHDQWLQRLEMADAAAQLAEAVQGDKARANGLEFAVEIGRSDRQRPPVGETLFDRSDPVTRDLIDELNTKLSEKNLLSENINLKPNDI